MTTNAYARNARNLLKTGKITKDQYEFILNTMNSLLKKNQELSIPLYTSVRIEDTNEHDEIVFVRTYDGENPVTKLGNAIDTKDFVPTLLTGEIKTITVDTDIYPGGILFEEDLIDEIWSKLE